MHRSLLSLVVLTSFWIGACGHEHEKSEEKGKLPVTSPTRKSTELTKEYVAQVRTIQHIELKALARGYLQGIFVDEGQYVRQGQPMFQILPLIYQAEVQKAKAEADRAEVEFNNTKLLADNNVVSPNELAMSKATLEKAQAELSLATRHKSFTEVRAPFSGIMGRFNVRKGSLIDEGELLTTLSDNSTVWVYFNVAEAEYLQYKLQSPEEKSRPVRLQMANGELFDQPGKIETIEADFNNETGTIAFRAAFPNPKGLLRHGQTGKILMTTPVENALLIPQKATFDVLDRKFVFVVDEKNIVHSKPITVSAELPHLFVVADGVSENDKILLDGLRKVRDGVIVETEFKKPGEVLAHLDVAAE
jgi:membrane fusion protein (multidrug efflux system)